MAEKKAKYDVTVKIAVAGTNQYKVYTNYTVYGDQGYAQMETQPTFTEAVPTTTARTTASTTASTTAR